MTTEFLLSSNISLEEATEHTDLIRGILEKILRPPKIKLLKNIKDKGSAVYRAKIDQQSRMIYKWEKDENNKDILHILAINKKHKYEEVKRELGGVNSKKPTLITINDDKKQPTQIETTSTNQRALFTNNQIIVPDKAQSAVLDNTEKSEVITGPPGAGKTTVLYGAMLLTLKKEIAVAEFINEMAFVEDEIPVKSPEKIIFFTHSKNLLAQLERDKKSLPGLPPITFTSWIDLLVKKNPGKKLIAENAFAKWLSTQKNTLDKKAYEIVHYELSLIAALVFEDYNKLGERQCFYAKQTKKKIELNKLLKAWLAHLEEHQLLDPLVSPIPEDQAEKYDRVFCDETQNMPPVALKYLITHTPKQGFSSSLDTEQCLTLSPYIENCLLTLLFKHYKNYHVTNLPKTYRCSKKVAEIACKVMQRKHQLDGNQDRRNYKEIESALDIDGIVSWVTKKNLHKLHEHCEDPETAVLIPDNTSPEEIEQIRKAMKTKYILRYSEAIGLDLKNVILWKPFSQVKAFKNLDKDGIRAIPDRLSLAQWQAFNAFYVALTRARTGVYIYEEDPYYKKLGEYLVDDKNLPTDEILDAKELTKDELTKKLNLAIETHLNQHQFDIARNLMVKLGMSDKEIDEKIETAQPVKISAEPVVVQPAKVVELKPNNKPAPAQKILTKTKAIPVEKTASQPVPKTDSFQKLAASYDYLDNLLKTKNPESLEPLFKHKNLIKFLFEIPIVDKADGSHHKSLFLRLLTNPLWTKKLLKLSRKNLATSPELRKQFSKKFLFELTDINAPSDCRFLIMNAKNPPPVFRYLVEHKDGLKILSDLFDEDLFTEISAPVFYATYTVEPDVLRPIFNILCESTKGVEVLYKIFETNQWLAKQISGESLCQVITYKNAGISYFKSALLMLLAHNCEFSKWIINELTRLNPSWLNALTPEVLCNPCSPEAGDFENFSVLQLLVRDLKIFQDLIATRPHLLQNITAKAFYNFSRGSSAFLSLVSAGSEGMRLLRRVLLENPRLVQEATLKDLCCTAVYVSEDAAAYPIPALYLLSFAIKFRDIFKDFFYDNIDLAKKITADVLCQPYGDDLAKGYGRSILFELLIDEDGARILDFIFEANPSVLASISYEALTMAINEELSATALFCFCFTSTGLKIFADLVDHNQNFAKKFTREEFTREYETPTGFRISIYNALLNTGQDILLQKLTKLLSPQFSPAKTAAQVGIFKNIDKKKESSSSSQELCLSD